MDEIKIILEVNSDGEIYARLDGDTYKYKEQIKQTKDWTWTGGIWETRNFIKSWKELDEILQRFFDKVDVKFRIVVGLSFLEHILGRVKGGDSQWESYTNVLPFYSLGGGKDENISKDI